MLRAPVSAAIRQSRQVVAPQYVIYNEGRQEHIFLEPAVGSSCAGLYGQPPIRTWSKADCTVYPVITGCSRVLTRHISSFSIFLLSRRRHMAGGFPANWKVKQNIIIEEWNGQREITEKKFSIGAGDLPALAFFILFPLGLYVSMREELKQRHPRQFKNIC